MIDFFEADAPTATLARICSAVAVQTKGGALGVVRVQVFLDLGDEIGVR